MVDLTPALQLAALRGEGGLSGAQLRALVRGSGHLTPGAPGVPDFSPLTLEALTHLAPGWDGRPVALRTAEGVQHVAQAIRSIIWMTPESTLASVNWPPALLLLALDETMLALRGAPRQAQKAGLQELPAWNALSAVASQGLRVWARALDLSRMTVILLRLLSDGLLESGLVNAQLWGSVPADWRALTAQTIGLTHPVNLETLPLHAGHVTGQPCTDLLASLTTSGLCPPDSGADVDSGALDGLCLPGPGQGELGTAPGLIALLALSREARAACLQARGPSNLGGLTRLCDRLQHLPADWAWVADEARNLRGMLSDIDREDHAGAQR